VEWMGFVYHERHISVVICTQTCLSW